MKPPREEIILLTQNLLDAIAAADWAAYERLCDPMLSAFEPEARGHMVEGMPFHEFYFRQKAYGQVAMTMSSPHVWMMNDSAVIAYVRLNQTVDAEGNVSSSCCEETRVWRKQDGEWKHIHFHRSTN